MRWLILILPFFILSCDPPLEERKDYKSGYDAGYDDGRDDICDQIARKLNDAARDTVCN